MLSSYNPDLNVHTVVVNALLGAIHVKLDGSNLTGWTLHWSDGITHESTEHYGDLSVTLARLSALMFCGESDWDLGFTDDAAEFTTAARAFLDSVTR